MQKIMMVWAYNGVSLNSSYLLAVSQKLANISTYFPGISYSNTDNFVEKLAIANANKKTVKVYSPVELRVIDSNGNISGLVDGQIVNNIPGISAEINSPGALKLQIEDAKILEQSNLLKIIVNAEGSYTVESPLFNNLSVTDTVSLSFDYRAKDSAGVYSNTEKVTVNVVGSNDALTTNDVSININENDLKSNNTTLTVAIDSQYALNNNTLDVDVLDDADYHRSGEKLGLTISTSDTGLLLFSTIIDKSC